MTSSAHDADLKGNYFRRTIHPLSFIAVAFIFSELDGGASGAPPPPVQKIEKKPGQDRVNRGFTVIAINNGDIAIHKFCNLETAYFASVFCDFTNAIDFSAWENICSRTEKNERNKARIRITLFKDKELIALCFFFPNFKDIVLCNIIGLD